MGGQSSNQKTETQATPEERELNKLALERARAAQPGMIGVQNQGLNLVNQLLTGQQLPGYLGSLPGGINENTIAERSIMDVKSAMPGLQSMGILNSGTSAQVLSDVASRTRMQAEQFNLQNLLQLLNLGVGGQAQVQSPILGSESSLGQRLAGLRSTSTTARTPFITGSDIMSGIGTGIGAFGALNPFLGAAGAAAGKAKV